MAEIVRSENEEIIKPEIRTQFISKAVKDEAFRLALLKNPRKAIKDEFGVDVPEGKTIHVVEQSPSTQHVIIPPRPGSVTTDMTAEKVFDLITRDMPKFTGRLNDIVNSYGRVVAKSWTDGEFRKRLLADPKAVISKEAEIDFPEGQKFVVHLEDDKNKYLALPPLGVGRELTDEEMEIISGGSFIVVAGMTITIIMYLLSPLIAW